MSGSVEAHGSYRAISGGSVAEAVASILPPTNSRIPPLKKSTQSSSTQKFKKGRDDITLLLSRLVFDLNSGSYICSIKHLFFFFVVVVVDIC